MLLLVPLRKKGGIFINKKIFFLITILSLCIFSKLNVHATSATFYEAEYIDNIYISKYNYTDNKIYYQKARVFRQVETNDFAYCIEPFMFFEDNSSYNQTITPDNLTAEQKDRISKIAYFGYGYENHTDLKWYAITQYMIWRETTNGQGEIYFTDTLNGNRVNYYDSEIAEIENLINDYNTIPSIANKTYYCYLKTQMSTGIKGIDYYESTSPDITIYNSSIITKQFQETGTFEYELIRKELNYNKPILFYQSQNSQNLMEPGDLEPQIIKFTIVVNDATITINKIDYDTLETTAQGDASLDGAIYEVYNWMGTKVGEIKIENGKGTLHVKSSGKFTLKEKSSGTGYTLDNNIYEVKIDNNDFTKEITLSNKVIEKKIKIIKKYGTEDNFIGEANIKFGIYNSKNELITTIITDSNGEANIILPYGEYEIRQLNTTKGYAMVDPFNIKVENNEEEIIELKDYEIPVPNTHTNINLLTLIFRIIYIILC